MENNRTPVQSAIAFIETHMDESLDLQKVAEGVHYSKYYLHRKFMETTGLTMHEYIQRRKLSEAAKLLVFTECSILEIAYLAGYESQQAFTTIFKAMYKKTPNEFRRQRQYYPLQLQFQLQKQHQRNTHSSIKYNIKEAREEDVSRCMVLVQAVIDGFPYLQPDAYRDSLINRMKQQEAYVMEDGGTIIGMMIVNKNKGWIDFLGLHPQYRTKAIAQAFLDHALMELATEQELSITTYRKGDKADLGWRFLLEHLGFAEAEYLVEFGYPTQRMVYQQSGEAKEEPCQE